MKIVAFSALVLATTATSAIAAPVFYSDASGKANFTTATAGYTATVEGFEGITTPTSSGIGSVAEGTSFSRNGVTITDSGAASTLTVLDNTYVNGGNQIAHRFGTATGSVLDAGYGSLTLTFDSSVNSFGIDLASIARGFVGNSTDTFVITEGGSSFTYNYSGSSGFGFLGLTDDSAFSTVTISAGRTNDDLFDNVTFGAAPAAAAAVPEPASWAMMVGGFGLIGGALRRKRVAVSFA